jgi:hypothetical protein
MHPQQWHQAMRLRQRWETIPTGQASGLFAQPIQLRAMAARSGAEG